MLKLQFTYLSKFLPRLAKEKERKDLRLKKGKIHIGQNTAELSPMQQTDTQTSLAVIKHRSDHSSPLDR